MSVKELEKRVKALERQVKQLQRAQASATGDPPHDWETTVEKFKNDEDVLSVLRDAMKIRQRERKAVRKDRTANGRPQS
jgi:hypothetical protein